jgi:hypothetical protein
VDPFCGCGGLSFGLFLNHLKYIEPTSIAPAGRYPLHQDCREGLKHGIGWFALLPASCRQAASRCFLQQPKG